MNTVIVCVFAVVYYSVTVFMLRGVRLDTKGLCISGIMIALTLLLDSIRFPLPTGATISLFSPVPLLLLAVLFDMRLAVLAGWACGVLSIFLNPAWQPVHWGQIFVEHLVCFSCLGYAGVFGREKKRDILCGIILASLISIIGHVLSGVLFFSQNAWEGWGAWGYSVSYNLSQNVPLYILSGVIILALPLKSLRRITEKREG